MMTESEKLFQTGQEIAAELLDEFGDNRHPELEGEAWNPADFDCVQTAVGVDNTGEVMKAATFSEAAPNCYKLQAILAHKFEERGFPGVEVVTEW